MATLLGTARYWWPKRMATAYEAQYGNWVLRICHLSGEFWKGKPWRRFSFKWHDPNR